MTGKGQIAAVDHEEPTSANIAKYKAVIRRGSGIRDDIRSAGRVDQNEDTLGKETAAWAAIADERATVCGLSDRAFPNDFRLAVVWRAGYSVSARLTMVLSALTTSIRPDACAVSSSAAAALSSVLAADRCVTCSISVRTLATCSMPRVCS